MKMLESIYKFVIFIYSLALIYCDDFPELQILGIEPNAGPDYGETRVLVRLENLTKALRLKYPSPKCRFGGSDKTVEATYVKCTNKPKKIQEREAITIKKNETCIQCMDSPMHEPSIIPLTISVTGDFSDVYSSIPFRYYKAPVVDYIYPRYGPQDGNTFVEVFGKNFLNFDQNLRCAFGSNEVKAFYVNSNYLICYTPRSDVVNKKLPFSISLNNQQNSRQDVNYVYYSKPQIFEINPNRGPDDGGTHTILSGQNFNPMKEIPDMDNRNDTFCQFGNDIKTPGKIISSTKMECVSPPSYDNRFYILEITLNNREYTDDNVKFFYYHPPFVYSISPKIGPTAGGTTVKITGSNFEDTGFVMCKFGEKIVTGTYVNENEILCVAPQVEKPAKVHLALAIRPDEFSSGVSTIYRYYDTPVIDEISPKCGPERGFTQITVKGKKFPKEDSEFIKCIFDRRIFKNATVIDENTLKCDSPSVLDENGENAKNVDFYTLELSLNGIDISGPAQNFYYYKESFIQNIEPKFGPLAGNTLINLNATNINHKNACNPMVRFSTIDSKPLKVNKLDNNMQIKSPPANYSGAVEVQIALNGQDYEPDTKVNFRDFAHTFYYYKFPIVTDIIPNIGPTTGNTPISVLGLNLNAPFYFVENEEDKVINYRFVDSKDENKIYGEIKSAKATKNSLLEVISPPVEEDRLKTKIQLSYNKQDFETIPNEEFVFYLLPNITHISPSYGPVELKEKNIKIHLDKYYCTDNCDNILCKYSSKNLNFIEKGFYVSPNLIQCDLPYVNSPENYIVEASFNNGEQFTNNKHTYTFYKPYVQSIEPQMIPSKGNSKMQIHGYGFADSKENLKVKFGGKEIKCANSASEVNNQSDDCIKNAKFINENLIEVETFPREKMYDLSTKKNLQYERFPVEVSVFNDDFTQNNSTVFFFDEPKIISDWEEMSFVDSPELSENQKKELIENLKKSEVKSLPANIDTFILLPVNSDKIKNQFSKFEQFGKYSCLFEKANNPKIYKVTEGLISSLPKNSNSKNIFFCQSPEWENLGLFNMKISLNGKDFSDSKKQITFTEPLDILHMEPKSGPLDGNTEVDIYGTGFDQDENMHFKWGIFSINPFTENNFLKNYVYNNNNGAHQLNNNINNSNTSPNWLGGLNPKYPIKQIKVKSPKGYSNIRQCGGPEYIVLTKANEINFYNLINSENINNSTISNSKPYEYIHANSEFYYYRQPYVQAIHPKGSIVTGGTEVIVFGAWFQNLPKNGVRPYCKFGDKIVRGRFISTVRISCISPEYNQANVKVPFEVSLNKKDFTNSGLEFTFYNDFKYAKFNLIEPQSGPQTGGTHINIYGKNFTNMVDPEEFLCKFESEDKKIMPKIVPAGFKNNAKNGEDAIICNSPGGWKSGTKAKISITFDGQNFINTGFDFYFYKVDKVYPLSGPNTGNGPINLIGGGFKDSSKVKCFLEDDSETPVHLSENLIQCPMSHAKKGQNFTGTVDLGISLNGIDQYTISDGFTYYNQAYISNIYPKYGPSKGKGIVKVFGDNFKEDFKNAKPSCKIGNVKGKAKIKSITELDCEFEHIPLIPVNKTLNFSFALNDYSYTQERMDLTYVPYGISKISPSSGPIKGGSRIEVNGAGFFNHEKIRCRFGVPGYFFYTEAEVINYNLLICSSPLDYQIPNIAELPFAVPFSVAFGEDDFNPWTETSHVFTFYNEPEIISISPIEGKTSETNEITLTASLDKPFSTPSALIIEEDIMDYTNSKEGEIKTKSTIAYQPITCKFGNYGTTQGVYFNRTLIKCLSPTIQDDEDMGYEDVYLELSLNGVDYHLDYDINYTFIGPAAGRMLWIYIIIAILTALLLIIFAALISSYWNRLNLSTRSRDVFSSDQPHVLQKRPRYIVQNRPELQGDLLGQENPQNNA